MKLQPAFQEKADPFMDWLDRGSEDNLRAMEDLQKGGVSRTCSEDGVWVSKISMPELVEPLEILDNDPWLSIYCSTVFQTMKIIRK